MIKSGLLKKAVEDYPNFLAKAERLQNRIINLSGRDPVQETLFFQQLEQTERIIELLEKIDSATQLGTLKTRETYVISRRKEGATLTEIAEAVFVTPERIRQILQSAYRKMAILMENHCVSYK